MRLDQLTVHIRPLSPYQSLDLGMVMARHWRKELSQFWWDSKIFKGLLVLLLWTFISGFFESYKYFSSIWLLLAIAIFLRINIEIKMMLLLSQKVFDHNANKETALSVFNTFKRPTLTGLKYIISPSRIVIMAVTLLENQTGTNRSKRLRNVLRGGSNALWLQSFGFMCIELILFFGAVSLLVMMVSLTPYQGYNTSGAFEFLMSLGNDNLVMFIVVSLYLITSYIITPFFVASSFALYMCRRSLLEGWDIEIEFRKMAERYTKLNSIPHKKSMIKNNGENHE